MQVTLVTGNQGKLDEIKKIIHPKIELKSQDLDITEIQSQSLEEVSKNKAIQAYEKLKSPVLVDDTGVYFNKYPDFPGVFAKFVYQSLGKDGIKRLFDGLEDNSGSMQTVISYMDNSLSEPISFLGKAEGKFETHHIDEVPENSLPYNYIFVPNGWNQTVAQNYDLWKSDFSQRKKAIQQFNQYIGY
ncbi:non-canonical purine NTP pyrophosphatase [Candidatus Absconditicoccus praedator]|uniref:non-canonical purine NTP pyrophosphatase n=1 Tax=Candidatus Absconditicoccus praedator TaxID=2735562 RepID=UPI001E59F721|nr:non-canonical purine NTP pyrophosphatase [Candidatus Absconditicoccus praedator]UFX82949.1 hypothetical protein HLG78_02335 [Candidatus Absconditicoccus praedator]